jgi:holdfast attachment protein HfaA
MRESNLYILTLAVLCGASFLSWPAAAQSMSPRGGTLSVYEAGYADGRAMDSRPYDPSTRDANGNRVIVNGVIRTDATVWSRADGTDYGGAAGGADFFSSGATNSSVTAIGNLLTVTVDGSWNTVIVNSTQNNAGNVTAAIRPR